MKAIRWHGRLDVRVEDIDIPPAPAPGEVQVEVLACGICGTDTEEYRHGPLFVRAGSPHPLTGRQAPIVLGHEVAGRVVACGDNGGAGLVGQLVAVDGLISCGRCASCRAHRVNLCEQLASIGFSADGGLAALLNAPARGCIPLPEGVGADAGALAETLSVGVRALRRARLEPGEDVVVFGGGAVGLLAAQAAAARGAGRVLVVEPDPRRRELAGRLGLAATTPEQGGGERPEGGDERVEGDVVLECSGAPVALAASIAAARPGGRVVMLSVTTAETVLPLRSLVWGEREVLGSLSHVYDEDLPAAVELLGSGLVRTAELIETTGDLDVALARIAGEGAGSGAVKLVVHPPTA